MSWWYELKAAVQTRLTGDATLVALLSASTRVVDEIGTPETASMYPYIVKRFASVQPFDAFRTNISVVDIDVQARAGAKQQYGGSSPLTRVDAILARILGDWEAQTGAPTYGLDRWTHGALGSTGYTAGAMVRVSGPMPVQEDNVIGVVTTFRVHVSKQAA